MVQKRLAAESYRVRVDWIPDYFAERLDDEPPAQEPREGGGETR